jgi:hypothetical protein
MSTADHAVNLGPKLTEPLWGVHPMERNGPPLETIQTLDLIAKVAMGRVALALSAWQGTRRELAPFDNTP